MHRHRALGQCAHHTQTKPKQADYKITYSSSHKHNVLCQVTVLHLQFNEMTYLQGLLAQAHLSLCLCLFALLQYLTVLILCNLSLWESVQIVPSLRVITSSMPIVSAHIGLVHIHRCSTHVFLSVFAFRPH